MKPADISAHQKLRKFIRQIPAGEYLFRQGDPGSSMFIVLVGTIELREERTGKPHTTGLLGPGEFLGEKALIFKEPYPRHYSARASGDANVLEIPSKDLEFMKIAAPDLMLSIMTKIFSLAVHRLDNLNFLVKALRPSGTREKLKGCLLFLCRSLGQRGPQGLQLPLSAASLLHYVDTDEKTAEDFLAALVREGKLKPIENGAYLVPGAEAPEKT